MPLRELMLRSAGGVLVVCMIVGGIWYGSWVWSMVAGIVAIGSQFEVYQLLSDKYKISKAWGLMGGIAVIVMVALGFSFAFTISVFSLVTFLVLFTEVVRRQVLGNSYALWNVGGTLFGLVYVVLPWCFMIAVRNQTWGHIMLYTLFGCTWSCDVFAYIIGSRFGTSRLCPRVSPGKTWEGFWAGAVASALTGVLLAIFFEFPPIPLLILGLLCGIAGQIGDLGESVLKREAAVKDTGHVIPGHGGLLDRFDSILINASLAFFIFEALG